MKKFDAIIIGSGQAGTPLAFTLAGKGKKVAFIEKKHFGGTCVNNGCTPTKTYVASARKMWDTKHADELGVHIPAGVYADLKKIKQRKNQIIQKSIQGIEKGAKDHENITVFEGTAKFTAEKTVAVNGEHITAPDIYINAGARPLIPEDFKKADPLTNETILELEQIPEHLIVIGGSYIGLEFGQMFRRFGSKVTIVEKGNKLIGREDESISDHIYDFLKEEDIDIHLNASCIGANKNKDGSVTVSMNCDGKKNSVVGSHVLVAVGRIPNTDTLNLEDAGIKTNKRGFIETDDFLETNVKGVFALGDCNGKGAFTHTAYNDYEIVLHNHNHNHNHEEKRKVSDRIMTYALFTDPPLGRAGYTKKAALEKGLRIREETLPMSQVARATEKGETKGMMQVILEKETNKVLGAAILGVGGDEIISSILHVMQSGATWDVVKNTIKPHPTVSELLPFLKEDA